MPFEWRHVVLQRAGAGAGALRVRISLSEDGALSLVVADEHVDPSFGTDGIGWDEEKVLERYELLYEAGLVQESARDGRGSRSK